MAESTDKDVKQEEEEEKELPENDKELQELLNSALQDFDKSYDVTAVPKSTQGGLGDPDRPRSKRSAEGEKSGDKDEKSGDKDEKSGDKDEKSGDKDEKRAAATAPELDMFSPELAEQAAAEFEQIFKSLMQHQPEMIKNLESMASSQGTASSSSTGDNKKDIGSTLDDTAQSMEQNTQNLQQMPFTEEELMEAMGQLGLGGGGGDDVFSNIQAMVQGLLSKDVLYPSLKDLCDKYPAWLSEHQSSLPSEELSRYQCQYELMSRVCSEFESEQEGEGDAAAKERFERVIDLMQSIQNQGQPPPDLVGDMPNMVEFDENGLPKLPAGMPADGCSIM